jgi:flagellin
MALSINTNVNSLTAQRNLTMSQSSLSTSMQRLSSGLRVNSAKDDAAGLAISERMNAQVRGLNVASRNSNDGVSLAQTAEGALGKIGDMLQRMRELAVQSSNATNSATDRAALGAEVTQLRSEIDRVAKNTSFNGTKLLDGGFNNAVFQVGSNSGEGISVSSIVNAQSSTLGSTKISRESVGIVAGSGTTPAGAAADAQVLTTTEGAAIAAGTLTINDANGTAVALGAIATATTNGQRNQQVVDAINAKAADTGVNARVTYTAGVATGFEIFSDRDTLAADFVGFTATVSTAAPAGATVAASTPDTLKNLSVSSFGDAQLALKIIDNSINAINSSRADLGALQSRFENAISNISIQSENTSAARGRIVDADFASETANMSRANILQQAGTAMVAQANQGPQQVLQLLR